ncbi:glycosyltransferase [Sphingomonas montana]|uniref:glycosyltransferase n=1 Tax=Sphingomonas montana TaxID=1843236 RepID=UPI00096DE8A2|nr:glycosyltransferase [Sphingomonas montana]
MSVESGPDRPAPDAGSPLVSVVSAFYNRGYALPATLDCLLGQTLRDIEVIVIDDGSRDDTAAILRACPDPRLRPIIQANAGFVVSMNRAIRSARGKYIAIHGSGDVSYPERLAKQAAYLEANPEVGAVGCVRRSGPFVVGPKDAVLRGPMLERMMRKNPFTHGEVMYRRDLWERVGGYREIFRFAQDRDLWLRMGHTGCDYAVLPELLYDREYQPDGVSKTPQALFLQTKLSQFAVQNAGRLDDKGRDLIDRFGPSAFFLIAPERALAKKYTLWGLRALRDGDRTSAAIFLPAGWREWRGLYSFAGITAWRLAQHRWLERPLRAVLKAGTPDHGPGEG